MNVDINGELRDAGTNVKSNSSLKKSCKNGKRKFHQWRSISKMTKMRSSTKSSVDTLLTSGDAELMVRAPLLSRSRSSEPGPLVSDPTTKWTDAEQHGFHISNSQSLGSFAVGSRIGRSCSISGNFAAVCGRPHNVCQPHNNKATSVDIDGGTNKVTFAPSRGHFV